MALNTKYRNLNEVIEQVHRDYGFTNINKSDCAEWVGEVMELIGEIPQFIKKKTDGNHDLCHLPPIEIINGRAELPCDLMSLISVKDAETGMALVNSLDLFAPDFDDCVDNTSVHAPDEIHYNRITKRTPASGGCDSDEIKRDPRKLVEAEYQKTYRLENGFIKTNFRTGYLIVAYTAYPTDDEGFPLIPDSVSFMNAAREQIAMKHAKRLMIQNKFNPQMYQMIVQDREWYVGQAKNKAILPTVDEMEAFKNQFLRLIPRVNAHRDGFKTHSIQEAIRNRYTVEGVARPYKNR